MGLSSTQDRDGQVRKKKKQADTAELKLLDSQDAKYITMREQMDKKAVERRSEQLHFLDADKPNRHTIFVDDDDFTGRGVSGAPSSSSVTPAPTAESLRHFDVAGYFDTHPALLGRKANRPTRHQLESGAFTAGDEEEQAAIDHAARRSYRELLHRQERAQKLGLVRQELELRQHMRGK